MMQRVYERLNLVQDLESLRLLLRTDFCIRLRTSLLRSVPSMSLTLQLSPLENPPRTSSSTSDTVCTVFSWT